MTPREQRTVVLALSILRTCARPMPTESNRPPAMRLALRVLLPYVHSGPLTTYWKCADNPNPSQRGVHLRSQINLIEADLLHAGAVLPASLG